MFARRADAPRDVGFALFHLGDVYLSKARYPEAIDLCAEAVDIFTKISHAEGLAANLLVRERALKPAREQLAGPALAARLREGRDLDLRDAVTYALEDDVLAEALAALDAGEEASGVDPDRQRCHR